MSSNDECLASTLQYTHMKTVSKNKCFLYLPTVAFRKSVICAVGTHKQSICSGDIGGPLIEITNQHLVGISSYRSTLFGCDSGAPQAYTRISEYAKWVKKVTGISCQK